MPNGQLGAVATQLQRLFDRGTVAGLTEGQLLERFARQRDDAAFEALVTRHGPMVLTVCRRLLTDQNDVEDAVQATFLVLVKKAGSIQRPDRLGNWLYGVAHRVAARARADARRRHSREAQGRTLLDQAAEPRRDPSDVADLAPLLHEELGRLPEKYRAPLVLCSLEGLTHEQAARALGWPVGTVKGRLARGKDQLRGRLTRRGLTLPAGIVATVLAQDARAALPPVLLNSTVKAAMSFAAGPSIAAGTVSAAAVLLAKGVLKTMFTTKLKVLALSLLATGALGGGAGAFALQGDGPTGADASQPVSNATDSKPTTSPAPIQAQDEAAGKITISGPDSLRIDTDQVIVGSLRINAQAKPADSPDADTVAKARAKLAEAQANLAKSRAEKALRDYEEMIRGYEGVFLPAASVDKLYTASTKLITVAREVRDSREDRTTAMQDHLNRMKNLEKLVENRMNRVQEQSKRPEGVEDREKREALEKVVGNLDQRNRDFYEKLLLSEVVSRAQVGVYVAEAELWLAEAKVGLESSIPGTDREGGKAPSTKPAPDGPPRIETPDEDAEKTAAIEKALSSIISMPFANETPLKDVIKYIKTATINNTLTDGIPIYLDPSAFKYGPVFYGGGGGIQQQTPKSLEDATITLNLEGVRLRTCLRLMLNQLGLAYTVKEGLLIISSPNSPEIKAGGGGMGGMGGMGGGMGGMR